MHFRGADGVDGKIVWNTTTALRGKGWVEWNVSSQKAKEASGVFIIALVVVTLIYVWFV